MGRHNGTQSKGRKVLHRVKSGKYHLDLIKHPDSVYLVHLHFDADTGFGIWSGYNSIPLNTWDYLLYHFITTLKLFNYAVFSILPSSVIFFLSESTFYALPQNPT